MVCGTAAETKPNSDGTLTEADCKKRNRGSEMFAASFLPLALCPFFLHGAQLPLGSSNNLVRSLRDEERCGYQLATLPFESKIPV